MSDNPFYLRNKVVIITGASSGIGRQCAISCSKVGAKIILIARDGERLSKVLGELEGEDHIYKQLDITNYDEIEIIIKECVTELGKIDGFIHSAGIDLVKPLRVMTHNDYEKIFAVNVFSGFEFAKILSKKKYSNDSASLVFISSIMSENGQLGKIAYCSSKAAIVGGVKALALELANRNIRVNSVHPAVVNTEMTKTLFDNLTAQEQSKINEMHPLGIGDCSDVANASIFLLSEAAKWVTGSKLIVDGGYSAR